MAFVSRRRFLGNIAAVSLAPATIASILHAGVVRVSTPEELKDVVIEVKISEQPALKEVGGSIKLTGDQFVNLNPDHTAWNDDKLRVRTAPYSCHRGWYPIAVTRLKPDGTDAFAAVSTFCPHELEYQVNFEPEASRFVCCHMSSAFRPDGSWIPPTDPNAADPEAPHQGTVTRGLRRFTTEYDGEDVIMITIS